MAGNIKVIRAERPFQKVAKDIIYDKTIDPFTLGIYVKVLAYGDRPLAMKSFAKMVGISDGKLRAGFAALEAAGYLRRTRIKDTENKRFIGWDYEVGEVPFNTDIEKSRLSENLKVGKSENRESRLSEKPHDNNKEYSDNREYSISKRTISETKTNFPPTPLEVAAYCRTQGFKDPDGFAAYYCAYQNENGWMTGKGKNRKPIDNWKLNVISWGRYHKTESFADAKGPKATRTISDDDFFRSMI